VKKLIGHRGKPDAARHLIRRYMRNGHVQISRESGLHVLGGEESLLRREILHRLLYELVHILLKVVRKFHRVLNLFGRSGLPKIALRGVVRYGNFQCRQAGNPYVRGNSTEITPVISDHIGSVQGALRAYIGLVLPSGLIRNLEVRIAIVFEETRGSKIPVDGIDDRHIDAFLNVFGLLSEQII